jgi:hypothetical protein
MSDPFASQTPTGEDQSVESAEPLQFEQAEFETPAADRPSCTVCHQPIPHEYYEINGKVMCPPCRQGVEAAFRGGSPLARFLKAMVFGTAAAVVGAVIYHVSIKMTNYNLALVSILVGFIVGKAVRKGTGNRGGWPYQLLAVFLTYTSIGLTLASVNIPEWLKEQAPKPKQAPAAEKPAKADPKAEAKAQEPDPAPVAPPGRSALVAAVIFLIILTYALPILDVVIGPIAGLIYAFALWEAWKINRPIQLVFNGPFRLAQAGLEELNPERIDHGG